MSYIIAFLSGVLGGILGAGIQQLGQRYRDKKKWDELTKDNSSSIVDNVGDSQKPESSDLEIDRDIDGDKSDSDDTSDSEDLSSQTVCCKKEWDDDNVVLENKKDDDNVALENKKTD